MKLILCIEIIIIFAELIFYIMATKNTNSGKTGKEQGRKPLGIRVKKTGYGKGGKVKCK